MLVEVRRLQALLGERDGVIEDLRRESEEASRNDESLREVVRTLEGSNGQFLFLFIDLSFSPSEKDKGC